jgi:hypothetical protein
MPRPAQPSLHPLRGWRVRHEISIVMLAEAAKLSTASISRIERGQQHPRNAAIRRLIEISDSESHRRRIVLPIRSATRRRGKQRRRGVAPRRASFRQQPVNPLTQILPAADAAGYIFGDSHDRVVSSAMVVRGAAGCVDPPAAPRLLCPLEQIGPGQPQPRPSPLA